VFLKLSILLLLVAEVGLETAVAVALVDLELALD
jgi:hypothetical protein